MAGISGFVLFMWIPMYLWGRQIRYASWNWAMIRLLVHWDADREVGE